MATEISAHYMPVLEKLIAFPSVSSDSNLELIDYVEDFLEQLGFDTRRFYNEQKSKANLLARLGPEKAGGLMLAGHTDVVPVTGQDWHSNPFALITKEHRYYGRGTADMKGFLALALAAAAKIDTTNLQRPLYLAFTYDEEIGCLGAKALLAELRALSAKPAFVLIGEPTDMALVTAHKGLQLMKTKVKGKPAHSSCPHLGASAIVFAAKMISRFHDLLPLEQDSDFDPPGASFNVGVIEGGAAINIIPEYCQFLWEVRPLPGCESSVLDAGFEQLMQELLGDAKGIEIDHRVLSAVPGLGSGQNQNAVDFLARFLKCNDTKTAPFVTEGGLYQQAGIPAVICGPGRVEEAHQPDEFVAHSAMERYGAFLADLLKTLEGGHE